MIAIFALVIVIFASACWLWLRRSGLGRQEKAAADEALCKLYRRYWAEVRALAQEHMLNAPSDEEWLADIRGASF